MRMITDRFFGRSELATLRQKVNRQRQLVSRQRARGETSLADEALLAHLLAHMADLMRSREALLRLDMRRTA